MLIVVGDWVFVVVYGFLYGFFYLVLNFFVVDVRPVD